MGCGQGCSAYGAGDLHVRPLHRPHPRHLALTLIQRSATHRARAQPPCGPCWRRCTRIAPPPRECVHNHVDVSSSAPALHRGGGESGSSDGWAGSVTLALAPILAPQRVAVVFWLMLPLLLLSGCGCREWVDARAATQPFWSVHHRLGCSSCCHGDGVLAQAAAQPFQRDKGESVVVRAEVRMEGHHGLHGHATGGGVGGEQFCTSWEGRGCACAAQSAARGLGARLWCGFWLWLGFHRCFGGTMWRPDLGRHSREEEGDRRHHSGRRA